MSARAASTSEGGRADVSVTGKLSAAQSGSPFAWSVRALKYSSENRLTPLGVPMKSAQPRRSESAGRTIFSQTSGFMSATSSSTTPSK